MASTDEASAGLGTPDPDDPAELARMKAVVEARLLGEEPQAPRIGRYAILSKLGEGGMGVVYAAFDDSLDRRVALKLLRAAHDGEAGRTRLLREAQALARLSHPNVVHVYEVGEHDGRVFLAMEYVRGESLRQWTTRAKRSWREIVERYAEAGRGLAAAHAAGLVHRDFKPENAIVGDDPTGRVRVLDFGLARQDGHASIVEALDDHVERSPHHDLLASPLTHAGSLIGTPAYMAPEQFLGETTDARTDQFGFCVALYEALYGERPFAGATRLALIAAVTGGNLREAPRASRVPTWVRAALVRGLAPSPGDRWPSMDALLAALAADPTRRRRTIAGVLAIAALAGGVAIGDRVIDSRRAAACADDAALIHADWDDAARSSVRDGLLATKLGYAATTADKALAHMDDFAQEWSEVAERTCIAATIDRTLPEPMHERSQRCLDRARERFVGSAEVLASADKATVERAHRVVFELPPPMRCEDPAVLQRMAIPPAELEAQVAELRSRSARLGTRVAAGDRRDAVSEAQALATEAAALGWSPLQVELGLQLAGRQLDVGGFAEAEATLEPVFLLALRDGDTKASAEAARLLLAAVSRQHRIGEAQRWWGIANALLDHAAEPEVSLPRATLDDAMGEAYWAMANGVEARRWMRKALDGYEELLGPESLEYARALLGLANNIEDEHEALAMYARAAEIQTHVLGPEHPAVGVVLNNTAQAELKLDRRERARDAAERAIAILEAAHGPESPQLAIAILNSADAHLALGDDEEAERRVRRASTLDTSIGGLPGRSSGRLIDIFMARGDLEGAVAEAERAVAQIDARGRDPHPGVVLVLHKLAYVQQRMGRLDESERTLERARALATPETPSELRMLSDLGRAHQLIARARHADARPLLAEIEARCAAEFCLPIVHAMRELGSADVTWTLDGDHAAARALAQQARSRIADDDKRFVQQRAQILEWLAAHELAE